MVLDMRKGGFKGFRGYFMIACLFLFASCNTYRQSIMFRTEGPVNEEAFITALKEAEQNYRLIPGDVILFDVYTNKGERIIDPAADPEFQQAAQMMQQEFRPSYAIRPDGFAVLPLIGKQKLAGLAIYQVDSMLAKAYLQFYTDPFVITRINSRRVIVLGATRNSVIPLTFENMNLIEVLALSGGPNDFGRVKSIRLIRGDLKNPSVQLIDLSTIEGMKKSHLKLQPNDIIYIEPVDRTALRITGDILPLLGVFVNLITLVIVFGRL
jgi:polysaccharide export outer membrane protein